MLSFWEAVADKQNFSNWIPRNAFACYKKGVQCFVGAFLSGMYGWVVAASFVQSKGIVSEKVSYLPCFLLPVN